MRHCHLPLLKPTLSVMRVMELRVDGAAESIVMVSAEDAGDVCLRVVAIAVMAWEPSFRAADVGTVKDQSPLPSVLVVPRDDVPAKSSMVCSLEQNL